MLPAFMCLRVLRSVSASTQGMASALLRPVQVYTGGFDLRSRNYIASVAFVGLPGYIIGVFCLLAAVFLYLLRCCCCCCCHRGFCLHPSASGYNR